MVAWRKELKNLNNEWGITPTRRVLKSMEGLKCAMMRPQAQIEELMSRD
jgi:hypothetical protein